MSEVMNEKNILILEDDLTMRRFLQNYLMNYHVVTAKHNVLEALEWIEEGNIPDLAICDINMPEIPGSEFIKYIRSTEFYNKIPILVVSGNSSSDDKIEAISMGANDYITKPFNPRELQARINNLLGLQNLWI